MYERCLLVVERVQGRVYGVSRGAVKALDQGGY